MEKCTFCDSIATHEPSLCGEHAKILFSKGDEKTPETNTTWEYAKDEDGEYGFCVDPNCNCSGFMRY